jgi:hypothetical protein
MSTHLPLPAFRRAMVLLFAAMAIGSLSLGVAAQDEKGAGLVISPEAKSKDVGLPIYPGSKPHKDKDDDSTSANLGLWGGGSGFKLAVLKMETPDSPAKVAEYYKKALAKYGAVLDCSKSSCKPQSQDSEKDDSSKALTCGDDKAESGGMLFKSGTKDKQHIANIQPLGSGTFYQLVYVRAWDSKGKNRLG